MADIHKALDIQHNAARRRYEADTGAGLAVAEYILRGDQIVFTHTEVPEALEGRGIGGQLAHFALEDAKARRLSVVPSCPFIADYIRRHPEYAPLLDSRRGA